jgi:hypothetical protein
MLPKLNPVTPCPPRARKRTPPTIPPIMPSIISRSIPSPVLLTTRLAKYPLNKPTNIQDRTPALCSIVELSVCAKAGEAERKGTMMLAASRGVFVFIPDFLRMIHTRSQHDSARALDGDGQVARSSTTNNPARHRPRCDLPVGMAPKDAMLSRKRSKVTNRY